jgi:hypothetical protein
MYGFDSNEWEDQVFLTSNGHVFIGNNDTNSMHCFDIKRNYSDYNSSSFELVVCEENPWQNLTDPEDNGSEADFKDYTKYIISIIVLNFTIVFNCKMYYAMTVYISNNYYSNTFTSCYSITIFTHIYFCKYDRIERLY